MKYQLSINTESNLNNSLNDIKSSHSSKKIGRKKGSGIISQKQQDELTLLLKTKVPKDFNFDSLFWSAKNVSALIFQKYKITLPLSTTRDYLNSWFKLKKNTTKNQINMILTNGLEHNIPEKIKVIYEKNKQILLNAKKEKALVFLIKFKTDGLIEIISRANKNNFIFLKTIKEKIKCFNEMPNFYKNKKLYLLFDNQTEYENLLNTLTINPKFRIYSSTPNINNYLINDYTNEKDEFCCLVEFNEVTKEIRNNKFKKTKKPHEAISNKLSNIEIQDDDGDFENIMIFDYEWNSGNIMITNDNGSLTVPNIMILDDEI